MSIINSVRQQFEMNNKIQHWKVKHKYESDLVTNVSSFVSKSPW